MELDQMYIDNDRDGNVSDGDKVADAIGLSPYLIKELNKVCIHPVLWNENTIPHTAGFQEIDVTELAIYTDMRDIPTTTRDFWTVYMISAFEEITHEEYHGVYAYRLNALAIFSDTILKQMVRENDTSTDFNLARQTTILHEIGHAFNLMDVTYLDSTWSQDYGVMVSECPICVYVEEGNMSFTLEDLKTMQQRDNIKYMPDA